MGLHSTYQGLPWTYQGLQAQSPGFHLGNLGLRNVLSYISSFPVSVFPSRRKDSINLKQTPLHKFAPTREILLRTIKTDTRIKRNLCLKRFKKNKYLQVLTLLSYFGQGISDPFLLCLELGQLLDVKLTSITSSVPHLDYLNHRINQWVNL